MLTYEDYKKHGVQRQSTTVHELQDNEKSHKVLDGILNGVRKQLERGATIKVTSGHSVLVIPPDEIKKIDKIEEWGLDLAKVPQVIRDQENTKHTISIEVITIEIP